MTHDQYKVNRSHSFPALTDRPMTMRIVRCLSNHVAGMELKFNTHTHTPEQRLWVSEWPLDVTIYTSAVNSKPIKARPAPPVHSLFLHPTEKTSLHHLQHEDAEHRFPRSSAAGSPSQLSGQFHHCIFLISTKSFSTFSFKDAAETFVVTQFVCA